MNLHDALMIMSMEHSKLSGGGYSDLLYFDYKNRNIKSKNLYLVKDGEIIPQKISFGNKIVKLDNDFGSSSDEFFDGVERRYYEYYNSIPSSIEPYVRSNFKPKHIKEMTYEQLMNSNCDRAQKRYELEWFVFTSKNVEWNNNNWYWQSEKYPTLFIYKEMLNA